MSRFKLRDLHVVDGNSAKGVVMLWWWNLGANSERLILKIKRLSPVDSGKTGAIDDHVARRCDKVAIILLRARHPETFIRCEQRALHFVHGGRPLGPPTRVRTG